MKVRRRKKGEERGSNVRQSLIYTQPRDFFPRRQRIKRIFASHVSINYNYAIVPLCSLRVHAFDKSFTCSLERSSNVARICAQNNPERMPRNALKLRALCYLSTEYDCKTRSGSRKSDRSNVVRLRFIATETTSNVKSVDSPSVC